MEIKIQKILFIVWSVFVLASYIFYLFERGLKKW